MKLRAIVTWLAPAAAFTLAACGGDGETAAPAPANVAADGMNYQAEVATLNDEQRNAVFIRAILDAGLQCQGVETATEQGAGSFSWNVGCIDGPEHVVAIGPDGTARVTSAARAR